MTVYLMGKPVAEGDVNSTMELTESPRQRSFANKNRPALPRTKERSEQITMLRKQGLSLKEIGERMNLSIGGIQKYLAKAGLTKANKAVNEDKRKKIVELKEKGMSRYAIAKMLGTSWNTVRNSLSE